MFVFKSPNFKRFHTNTKNEAAITFAILFHPSVRLHESARLLPEGFSRKFIFGTISTSVEKFQIRLQGDKTIWHFTGRPEGLPYVWNREI